MKRLSNFGKNRPTDSRKVHFSELSISEAGIGLIEVLMTLGLISILALGLSKMMTGTFSLQKKASIDDERLGLFASIRKTASCEKTYAALNQGGSCGPFLGRPINVMRGNDKVLVEEQGTKFGNWAMKAICTNDGIEFRVGYLGQAALANLDDPNVYVKDPVTKQPLDFNFSKNRIFPNLCSEGGVTTEPDLECENASRRQNVVIATKEGVVKKYDTGTFGTEDMKWGLTCEGRYNRMACSMSTPTNHPSDSDVSFMPRGCMSDNDEWEGMHNLHIICCKFTKGI